MIGRFAHFFHTTIVKSGVDFYHINPTSTSSSCFLFMVLSFGYFILFTPNAHADRSISIAVSNGVLELTNGSPSTVTYSVECYDKVNGTNLISNAANVTLATQKSIEYMSAGKCANNQEPTYRHTSGIMACAGTGTFAAAANLCGPNSTLCTLAQLSAKSITTFSSFPNGYVLTSGQVTWYNTYDNWLKANPYTESGGGKNYVPRTYVDSKSSDNYRCHTVAGTTGTGVGYCYPNDTLSNISGAICCPINNGFKSCKVTIHAATPSNGYLQSPQFKGGAAF